MNPYKLLAATRILACILMVPLLKFAASRARPPDGLGCADPGGTTLITPVH